MPTNVIHWIVKAFLSAASSEAHETRSAYRRAIALPDEKPSGAASAALDRAHELRKFEIENYWKRATYFWAFQFTAFTVAGWGASKASELSPLFFLFPCALGAISGWSAWLSSLGSKFWQENWESHVDALESLVEGRLTQVVLYQDRLAPSVSRVNEGFLLLLTVCWMVGAVLVCLASPMRASDFVALIEQFKWAAPALILIAGAAITARAWPRLKGQTANLDGPMQWSRRGQPKRQGRMVIRDTLHRPAKPLKSDGD